MEAWFSHGEYPIPIYASVTDYEGYYLLGSEEEMVDPAAMMDAFGSDDPVRMYLNEIGKEAMTAKCSSADSESAHKLCFIAYSYLAKLNSCLKYRRKILYEISEIHSV